MEIIKLENLNEAPYELLLDADPNREIVDSYLVRGETYIAKEGGRTIGVYCLIPTRPQTVELINVAVAPDCQGKGHGKALVLDAIEKARRSGAKTIEVGTGNSSAKPLMLYQRCGFRLVGIDPDFFTHHYGEKIFENGVWCRDMLRLQLTF